MDPDSFPQIMVGHVIACVANATRFANEHRWWLMRLWSAMEAASGKEPIPLSGIEVSVSTWSLKVPQRMGTSTVPYLFV